ncbi:polysaccharide deacetylase family protein [Taklimakanibacter deserti]|uniref:polysaccharide deacetylase family protein n=1 Tax=Taklimakanibacter deserti TaxID=2267839 RepID=UPI000E65CD9A
MIAVKHIIALGAATLFAFTAWSGNAKAANGACPGELPERTLSLSQANITRFGTLQKLPPLPLEKGEYVLSFDDGPRKTTTPKILDELRAACLHATFFMVGREATKFPFVARAVAEAGHSIGSHSFSHKRLKDIPHEEALLEMKLGQAAVQWAVFRTRSTPVRLFRFPENAATPDLMEAAARFDMIVASYDVSPEDWRGDAPQNSLRRLRQRLNTVDRGVIVMHDVKDNTVLLLPMVLDELKARGAKIVHLVE